MLASLHVLIVDLDSALVMMTKTYGSRGCDAPKVLFQGKHCTILVPEIGISYNKLLLAFLRY